MTEEVEGMDANPGDLKDAGWTVAFRSWKDDVRHGLSRGGGHHGAVQASASFGKVYRKQGDEARVKLVIGLTSVLAVWRRNQTAVDVDLVSGPMDEVQHHVCEPK
ncbi:hypothetical protein MRX96_004291 [Rhipicephalus microplus]